MCPGAIRRLRCFASVQRALVRRLCLFIAQLRERPGWSVVGRTRSVGFAGCHSNDHKVNVVEGSEAKLVVAARSARIIGRRPQSHACPLAPKVPAAQALEMTGAVAACQPHADWPTKCSATPLSALTQFPPPRLNAGDFRMSIGLWTSSLFHAVTMPYAFLACVSRCNMHLTMTATIELASSGIAPAVCDDSSILSLVLFAVFI